MSRELGPLPAAGNVPLIGPASKMCHRLSRIDAVILPDGQVQATPLITACQTDKCAIFDAANNRCGDLSQAKHTERLADLVNRLLERSKAGVSPQAVQEALASSS